MDDVQAGRRFRALRHRLGWRQRDLADRAGVSAGVVSLVERGRLERVTLRKLRRIARELDAEFSTLVRWHGGDLDRLVDEGHAALLGRVAAMLREDGWEVQPEVSYSIYGERGSIDLLAWHPSTCTILVIEIKTELVSVEETLRKHDEKVRLASAIARQQLHWQTTSVARLLVLPELSTARRRVERHRSAMGSAYPMRGPQLRRWLAAPDGAASGLLFLAVATRRPGPVARKRISQVRRVA